MCGKVLFSCDKVSLHSLQDGRVCLCGGVDLIDLMESEWPGNGDKTARACSGRRRRPVPPSPLSPRWSKKQPTRTQTITFAKVAIFGRLYGLQHPMEREGGKGPRFLAGIEGRRPGNLPKNFPSGRGSVKFGCPSLSGSGKGRGGRWMGESHCVHWP